MTIPTVTPITEVPIRSAATSATEYREKVEAYHNQLPPFSTELNASIAAINTAADTIDAQADQSAQSAQTTQDIYELIAAEATGELSGSASGSVTIGTGAQSFTASTGKIWWPGQWLYIRSSASAANWMVGIVASYDTGTGALTVNVLYSGGSGSYTDWLIYPAGPRGLPIPASAMAIKTDVASTTSTSWADTGLEATITLFDAANKVDVTATLMAAATGSTPRAYFRVARNGTVIAQGDAAGSRARAHFAIGNEGACGGKVVDEPGSVGPHTYKVQWCASASSITAYLNRTAADTDNASVARFASTLTLREIPA